MKKSSFLFLFSCTLLFSCMEDEEEPTNIPVEQENKNDLTGLWHCMEDGNSIVLKSDSSFVFWNKDQVTILEGKWRFIDTTRVDLHPKTQEVPISLKHGGNALVMYPGLQQHVFFHSK